MNNFNNLVHKVDAITYQTLPLIQEIMFNMSFHIGEYKYTVRGGDFNGWLLCDGRSLSRQDYHLLFNIIGTTFGSVDGNSFNLPDLRGRALAAIGHGSNLTNRNLGDSVGEETHLLTIPEMPAHTHTGATDSNGLHNHGGNTGTTTAGNGSFRTTAGLTDYSCGTGDHSHTISSDGLHTHTFTTGSTGGSQSHNNMQPTFFGGNIFMYSGYYEFPAE